jgi:hypothetical protein
VDQWGSSFTFLQASAAFAKAAKLRHLEPASAAGRALLDSLADIWSRVLPQSDARGMSNVLWASGKLRYANAELWSSTLAAFLDQLQHGRQDDVACQAVANTMHAVANAARASRGQVPGVSAGEVEGATRLLLARMRVYVTHPLLEGVQPQDISNALWGCAKLQIAADGPALDSLLQAMSRPAMLEAATSQGLSNTLWAAAELQQHCRWQPKVQPRVWQRLLGEQQLRRIADKDTPQGVSNALLSLAWLAMPARPSAAATISQHFAQECALQLLEGQVAEDLRLWYGVDVANGMWACAKLELVHKPFFDKAAAASPKWLPEAIAADVRQVAWACEVLRLQDISLVGGAVKRANLLLEQQQQQQHGMRVQGFDALGLVAVVSHAVAALDMQQLAADVKALVASSQRIVNYDAKSGKIGKLWEVHSWLVQQQLLDGQGLAGLLSEQQLAAGREASEVFQAQQQQQKQQQQH